MGTFTFFWHDYETFGVDPRRDRPAQFAGVRTDAELNPVGEPVTLYCRPSADYLPHPQACLLTGITPQQCLARGVPEREFARRIEAELGTPDTVGVGYNSIRFDDEVTRFLLWRNLRDPYAREWQNGCSRWDLLDVMRMAHALRPEGIEWPLREDGLSSFRLGDLSAANGLEHEQAHEALSDVHATLALARLLRTRQPRLFDFALGLRRKDRVMHELGLPTTLSQARPFLHISGRLGAQRGCLAVMMPLAMHPRNRNELIAWDLAHDPAELADLGAAEARRRLYTPAAELPEGVTRLPVKTVHLNRSPMVVGKLEVLSAQQAQRWGVDLDQVRQHAARAQALPDLSGLWEGVFAAAEPAAEPPDPEVDLYGGFVPEDDRRRLARLLRLPDAELAVARGGFEDARLEVLFARYKARHFPESLTPDEAAAWQAHCVARLHQGQGGSMTLEDYLACIDRLADEAMDRDDERAESILGELVDYAYAIAPDVHAG